MLHFICILFALNLPQQDGWRTFKDTLSRYTISYPSNWDQTYIEGATGFVSPYENNSDDFRENVNVTIQDLSSKPLTFEQYSAMSKQQYIEAYGQKSIVSEKDTLFCGNKTKKGIFRITYGDKAIELEQLWFVKGNKAFVITYTAVPDKFDQYHPMAEKVIKSFKLLK